jgi:hypothetical protein
LPHPALTPAPFGLCVGGNPERFTRTITRATHGFIIGGINRREPFDPRR